MPYEEVMIMQTLLLPRPGEDWRAAARWLYRKSPPALRQERGLRAGPLQLRQERGLRPRPLQPRLRVPPRHQEGGARGLQVGARQGVRGGAHLYQEVSAVMVVVRSAANCVFTLSVTSPRYSKSRLLFKARMSVLGPFGPLGLIEWRRSIQLDRLRPRTPILGQKKCHVGDYSS